MEASLFSNSCSLLRASWEGGGGERGRGERGGDIRTHEHEFYYNVMYNLCTYIHVIYLYNL